MPATPNPRRPGYISRPKNTPECFMAPGKTPARYEEKSNVKTCAKYVSCILIVCLYLCCVTEELTMWNGELLLHASVNMCVCGRKLNVCKTMKEVTDAFLFFIKQTI